MSSLREIDRDLDQIAVDAAHLAEVQKSGAARGKLSLVQADEELVALARGTTPVSRAHASSVMDDDGPPSGQIDVPDDVLKSSELPAVLALPPDEPAPLSLDMEESFPSGSGLDPLLAEDLAPVPTSASVELPVELAQDAPRTETRTLADPDADFEALLGESDDIAEPPPPAEEIEPEATTMFSAEDAERYSRPPSALEDGLEDPEPSDVELDLEEMVELEEDEPEAAARPRTAPPPPPRTAPPPPPGSPGARPSEAPPGRGFLGKLLQRKP